MSPRPPGRPPLGRNIAATYASQAWVTLAGLLFVPVYLRLLGDEAYGLVGFFTVLQVTFGLLDAGLTRTISREAARAQGRGDQEAALAYRRLVRAMQVLFVAVGLAGTLLLVALAGPIASGWLRNDLLPDGEVRLAVQAMAVAIGLRWAGGLYRGMVVGSERLAWLAGFNAAAATARFVGVVPVLAFVSATPTAFFAYQLAVAAVELAVLGWAARRTLPRLPAGSPPVGWSLAAIRPVLGFSAGIALTSVVWVLVTQTDKVVLSKLLLLADYGDFTLGVLVAGAILLATAPVATPLLPRLARLEAEGHGAEVLALYRRATQLVCILAFALAATLAAFPAQVLWAWTGDAAATKAAAPVVALYAIGNALLTVGAFPFYLQYASGDLRLHVWGNLAFVTVLVPALVAATVAYGTAGAGWTWLAANLAFLVAWVPVVHRRFAPGLHLGWLRDDVLPIVAAALVTAAILHWSLPEPSSRLGSLAVAAGAGLLVLAASAAASSVARSRARRLLARGAPA